MHYFKLDRNKVWYYVPNLLFPVRSREKEYLKDTLMDGELVMEEEAHDKVCVYVCVWSIVVSNTLDIENMAFSSFRFDGYQWHTSD